MSAHQPRKGFITQFEGFSRLQKCKEDPKINKLSLHFCSSVGRNEPDIAGKETMLSVMRTGVLPARIYKTGLVSEEYSPELSDWRNGEAASKRFAGRDPHSAGIFLAADYALKNLGEKKDTLTSVRRLALESMLSVKTLLVSDTLSEGNSMTVLALLAAGEKEAAGRVLGTMTERSREKGCFKVTPSGTRSFFDPSLIQGTAGCGIAVMRYLKETEK